MTNGTLLRYLVVALAIAITAVVVRAVLTKRRRPRPLRQPASPSPTPAQVVLSAEALAVLRLVAERPGESVSFQQVRELLGSSPRNTAEVIDELRRPGLVDWFGESAALGGHGYVSARGREWLATSAGRSTLA
jgi:hypothetical protein